MPLVSAEDLRELTASIFGALGAPDDLAGLVAEVLADNHLAGHDSHGILRIPQYVAAIRSGELDPTVRPAVVTQTAGTALVSGRGGFGQVVAAFAADLLADKAREHGVASVSAIEVGHTGRLAAFTERSARRGVVTFLAIGTVGTPITVPFGGREAIFGTNPIAWSIPAGDGPPVTFDVATSQIAAGKVKVAHAEGKPVPEGAIVDRDGRPSTDPEDFLTGGGALLPFGAHKGYGLAVIAELLGAALTGSDDHTERGTGSGLFLFGVSSAAFRDEASFNRSVASIVARIRAVPPADGFERVVVPGDPEAEQRRVRARDGVPVAAATWRQVHGLATELGVDVSALPAPN